MSENSMLTSEQAKVVRELDLSVKAFGRESAFTPQGLRNRVADIVVKFRELEALFPDAAKEAVAYYNANMPCEPEEKYGYQYALFNVLLCLHSFYAAEGFSWVARAYESLGDEIYALSTFSDEFNVNRGCWNAELA